MRFLGRAVISYPVDLLLLAFLFCLSFASVDSDDGEFCFFLPFFFSSAASNIEIEFWCIWSLDFPTEEKFSKCMMTDTTSTYSWLLSWGSGPGQFLGNETGVYYERNLNYILDAFLYYICFSILFLCSSIVSRSYNVRQTVNFRLVKKYFFYYSNILSHWAYFDLTGTCSLFTLYPTRFGS